MVGGEPCKEKRNKVCDWYKCGVFMIMIEFERVSWDLLTKITNVIIGNNECNI